MQAREWARVRQVRELVLVQQALVQAQVRVLPLPVRGLGLLVQRRVLPARVLLVWLQVRPVQVQLRLVLPRGDLSVLGPELLLVAVREQAKERPLRRDRE